MSFHSSKCGLKACEGNEHVYNNGKYTGIYSICQNKLYMIWRACLKKAELEIYFKLVAKLHIMEWLWETRSEIYIFLSQFDIFIATV